jgi:hypothetical protein
MNYDNNRNEARSIADLIGNHIGRQELSEHKKKSHDFNRKVALSCMASLAVMLGGLSASEHYNANKDAYDSKLTRTIHEYVMNGMPTNPLSQYVTGMSKE